jgi:hypothetical protein
VKTWKESLYHRPNAQDAANSWKEFGFQPIPHKSGRETETSDTMKKTLNQATLKNDAHTAKGSIHLKTRKREWSVVLTSKRKEEGTRMERTSKKIESVEQLKAESKDGADFFITLNGGCRSSKRIWWDGTYFYIYNFIDDTEQKLTPEQLHSDATNIGKAMDKGAFYKEEEEQD